MLKEDLYCLVFIESVSEIIKLTYFESQVSYLKLLYILQNACCPTAIENTDNAEDYLTLNTDPDPEKLSPSAWLLSKRRLLYVVSNCFCYRFYDDDKSWHLPKTDKEKSGHINA